MSVDFYAHRVSGKTQECASCYEAIEAYRVGKSYFIDEECPHCDGAPIEEGPKFMVPLRIEFTKEGDKRMSEVSEMEDEMSCESDARERLEAMANGAKWDVAKKCVLLPREGADGDTELVTCSTYEDMIATLQEEYEQGWDGSVPWDGGRVFEPNDCAAAEYVEEKFEERIAEMGWNV